MLLSSMVGSMGFSSLLMLWMLLLVVRGWVIGVGRLFGVEMGWLVWEWSFFRGGLRGWR